MQECGFHAKPLFGFQFLRDCCGFLQIRSQFTNLLKPYQNYCPNILQFTTLGAMHGLDTLTNFKIFTILNADLLKHNYKVQNSYSNNELTLSWLNFLTHITLCAANAFYKSTTVLAPIKLYTKSLLLSQGIT